MKHIDYYIIKNHFQISHFNTLHYSFLAGYGSVPGLNDQPPPYEATSIPTKGH